MPLESKVLEDALLNEITLFRMGLTEHQSSGFVGDLLLIVALGLEALRRRILS